MRLEVVTPRPNTPVATAPGMLAQWRIGALMQAVAVRDATTGQLFLDIGNSRYPARIASGAGSGPAEGEQLQVRVLRTSPVLALETVAGAAIESPDGELKADALRRYLPKQASPALLSSNLGFIARSGSDAVSLPRSVMQAAANLWQALPDTASLGDPKALEQAVRRSGIFLESSLASGDRAESAAAARTDLKSLMLQLSRALTELGARPAAAMTDTSAPAPLPSAHGPLAALPAAPATLSLLDTSSQQMNELSRQVDGAIARLTTVQVANASQDTPTQSFLVELPVRHDDRAAMVRLRFERDGSRRQSADDGDQSWSVEAALDLGAIGALHARVTLTGHRIGVQLRAESPLIVDTLAARRLELESMLRESGLEVERIVCLHGMPAGDAGPRPTRLLDVRA
ncbi:MAG: flagellar hook-length control protein FliK [Steroidobacteraceae bacterium]